MEIVKNVGNEIHVSIQLEVDYPSNNEDRKLAILDLKVWIQAVEGEWKVVHEHYTKPVSTKEVLRIMTNCSRNLPQEVRVKHVNEVCRKMQYSGYCKEFRYDVINSAHKAYQDIIEQVENNERPLYRPKDWRREERRNERENRRKNWFRKDDSESVIFVPYIEGSRLKKRYEQKVRESRLKIRIVEQTGRKLKSVLQKSDPFKATDCNREDCFVCKSGGKGDCYISNVTYEVTCQPTCLRKNVYKGETSNSAYTRGKKHIELLRSKHRDSILWKHCVQHHDGRMQEFRMNVIGRFHNDSLLRQVTESIEIENTPEETLMNMQTEWNITRTPRIAIR